jgi:hypothetical protein
MLIVRYVTNKFDCFTFVENIFLLFTNQEWKQFLRHGKFNSNSIYVISVSASNFNVCGYSRILKL